MSKVSRVDQVAEVVELEVRLQRGQVALRLRAVVAHQVRLELRLLRSFVDVQPAVALDVAQHVVRQ